MAGNTPRSGGSVQVAYKTTTIASSGTTTAAIDLTSYSLVGLVMPSAFTGTALNIKASADGVTYETMYDTSGNAFSISVGANRFIAIAPTDFAAARFIKLVSGSSEASERTITLALRDLR